MTDCDLFKRASRDNHLTDTVVRVGNAHVGNGFSVIAGPCAVESREQLLSVAVKVAAAGASVLRGGAFKARSSPYSFQGLGREGLLLLSEAKKLTGLPTVSEITGPEQLELFDDVDLIQVGARNSQNFELLRALGKTKKPVLLKRGFAQTIDELLMSAEYILAGGNENVILCERGIRTFETDTRNTLDIAAVPVLKRKTHLPVIVDPSHAGGADYLIEPLTLAAAAVGADGVMIEVHDEPKKAYSDGGQAITPEKFSEITAKLPSLLKCVGNKLR